MNYAALMHISLLLDKCKSHSIQVEAWRLGAANGRIKLVVEEIKGQVANGHQASLERELGTELMDRVMALR